MGNNLKRVDFVLLSHLQATWRRALVENVDPRLAVEREKRSFSLLVEFDPTRGRYHSWISHWRRGLWDRRGFRTPVGAWELDEVRRALERFERVKADLPPERRDVGRYRTIEDLRSATPTSIAENIRRAEKAALRAQAHRESRELFRDGAWRVVRAEGFVAARFWGLGTRWCTTQSEATYIEHARDGELLIFLTPRGKFQLATASGMFRNDQDGAVPNDAFRGAPQGFLALLRAKGATV